MCVLCNKPDALNHCVVIGCEVCHRVMSLTKTLDLTGICLRSINQRDDVSLVSLYSDEIGRIQGGMTHFLVFKCAFRAKRMDLIAAC